MRYFDYQKIAHEAKIPADKLEKLRKGIQAEFPKDEMMYELHMLRVCMAIRDGMISIEEALKPKAA